MIFSAQMIRFPVEWRCQVKFKAGCKFTLDCFCSPVFKSKEKLTTLTVIILQFHFISPAISKILSFQCKSTLKIMKNIFDILFSGSKSLKSSVYIILTEHINSNVKFSSGILDLL